MYWVSLLTNRHLQDLNPTLYGHEDCAPLQSFGPVTRDHWMIYYVDRGKGTLFSDGEEFPVLAGQLFFIRPGASTKIQADSKDPWFFHWIGFDGSLGGRLWQLPLVMDAPLPNRFEAMDMVEGYGENREVFLLSQLHLLFCDLFPGDVEDARVRQVRQYVREHYMSRCVVDELAREMNLDRHYLARLYRRITGTTIQEYLLQIRFAHAQALLRQGCSCTEAAERLGYSDLASFSRAYRKFYGRNPSSDQRLDLQRQHL